ncbi:MAG: ABC transporter permease [Gemmatimonadaceae bacterium]|nr:ABC transporter permease [Gemmatimonadaceae bacterium]
MTEPRSGSLFSVAALRQDLRFAGRMLVKSPLFTGMVVLTLALGIGLNTAVFSAIEAMLLRPLPGVREAGQLVQLYRTFPAMDYGSNSVPHFWDVRKRTTDVYSGVAAWSFSMMSVGVEGRPVRLMGQMVSADYFSVLGVQAARGRTFVPAEDEGRGAHPVAVLSDAGWKNLFGGRDDVVGRTMLVNGQNVDVIGVAPAEFHGALPLVTPVMWMPLMQLAQLRPGSEGDFENRGNNFMSVVARLKPGVTTAQARARMTAIISELRAEFPDAYEKSEINLVPQSEAGIHPTMRGAQVALSAVVMIVVGLLLLIACVNVANLFLARARDRAREMAIRLALGARRGELVRQLLVESLVFALVSGVAGLLVAAWTIGLGNRITFPSDLDFRPDLRLSPLVLAFSLGVTLVTGVLFGLAPALQATRPALIPALKGEAPAGGSRSRMSRGLVVAQMALSLVLLICAGLFLVNLRNATTIDKGFVSDHVLMAEVDPGLQGYTRGASEDFYRRLTERLSANPGVRSVGFTNQVPLGIGSSDRSVQIPGYTPAKGEGMSIYYASVSPGYFKTMGIPLLKGREFTAQDDSGSVRHVVVNQRFVDRFWPGQDAIGRTLSTSRREYTVVGVVPTGKYVRLGEDPTAHMWFSQAQLWDAGMVAVIRTTGDPDAFIGTLRSEVTALDANLPLSNIRSMDKYLGISLMPARLTGAALGVFGVLGLLLASVGMYGVMAYSVSQRTREIGIRMAIGAQAADVIRLVMRQGLTLVLIGTLIGLAGALAASRLLGAVLYGGNSLDLMTFTVVPVVLIAVAALASFVPARRAAQVDPMHALRYD